MARTVPEPEAVMAGLVHNTLPMLAGKAPLPGLCILDKPEIGVLHRLPLIDVKSAGRRDVLARALTYA